MVSKPTRGSNILHLIFTNDEDSVSNVDVVDSLPLCDHDAISFTVKIVQSFRQKRSVYDFRRADFDQYRQCLSKTQWHRLSGRDIEESWGFFKDVVFDAADQCIPKITLKSKRRNGFLMRPFI